MRVTIKYRWNKNKIGIRMGNKNTKEIRMK